jgi:hypothetical protein
VEVGCWLGLLLYVLRCVVCCGVVCVVVLCMYVCVKARGRTYHTTACKAKYFLIRMGDFPPHLDQT